MNKISDEDIPEKGVYYPHITSPTYQQIYNMRPMKPRKHPVVDK